MIFYKKVLLSLWAHSLQGQQEQRVVCWLCFCESHHFPDKKASPKQIHAFLSGLSLSATWPLHTERMVETVLQRFSGFWRLLYKTTTVSGPETAEVDVLTALEVCSEAKVSAGTSLSNMLPCLAHSWAVAISGILGLPLHGSTLGSHCCKPPSLYLALCISPLMRTPGLLV